MVLSGPILYLVLIILLILMLINFQGRKLIKFRKFKENKIKQEIFFLTLKDNLVYILDYFCPPPTQIHTHQHILW